MDKAHFSCGDILPTVEGDVKEDCRIYAIQEVIKNMNYQSCDDAMQHISK